MSVTRFRPHKFSYRVQGIVQRTLNNGVSLLTDNSSAIIDSTTGYVNELGDYVSGKSSFSKEYACNAVPNSGSASIKNSEGLKVEYSFTIYADFRIKDFLYGEVIRLDRCGIIYELTVKDFSRYNGFVKIWV